MLKIVLSICLITLISSSYTGDDLIKFLSVNIEKVYTHDANSITVHEAKYFDITRNSETFYTNLNIYFQVEAKSPEKTETATLVAYAVRLYLTNLEEYKF
jgi:hypothetical protein